ncbi:MAG: hypothetical protein JXB39_13460 [Deltaproteobacteria bacterium]|nr:hypothetical protein [Deltaproteobacteria bacterium]
MRTAGVKGRRPLVLLTVLRLASPLLFVLLATMPARAERIDRVVVVVGERVVTAGDLALEEALGERVGCPQPVLCDPGRPLLERLVDMAVVRGLAGDAATYRPTPAEVEIRLSEVRDAFSPPSTWRDFLDRFGLTEDALAGLLFSRMVVERYVHRNVVLPTQAKGGDDEACRLAWMDAIRAWRARTSVREVAPLEAL